MTNTASLAVVVVDFAMDFYTFLQGGSFFYSCSIACHAPHSSPFGVVCHNFGTRLIAAGAVVDAEKFAVVVVANFGFLEGEIPVRCF